MKLHMYRILKERRPGHVRDSGAIKVTVESPVYVWMVSYGRKGTVDSGSYFHAFTEQWISTQELLVGK